MSGLALFFTSWAGGVCAIVVGIVLGRVLTLAVKQLIGGPSRYDRTIEFLFSGAAVALWYWEVYALQLSPLAIDGKPFIGSNTILLLRWLSHLIFFSCLAAATWIDLRFKIIPDWITVTGVLIGFILIGLVPDIGLPVGSIHERSFAHPEIVPDILSMSGGLYSFPAAPWLSGYPHVTGLGVALIVFWVWWFFCTVPCFHCHDDQHVFPSKQTLLEPRNVLLAVVAICLVIIWYLDGRRFDAIQSSMIGLFVSAGLTWGVREGASRAMGQEAMGFGDVTLMAMIGVWLGWQPAILVFFMAVFIGLLHGLFGLILRRENELPYGPSLCLAAATVVVCWRFVWVLTGGFFSDPLLLVFVLGSVVLLTTISLRILRLMRGRN
ncbi:MAG: A24 family peptidase [Pirellulales bacterium]